MKSMIEGRLNDNLDRVESLVSVYEKFLAGSGQGRRGHSKTDVLRAACVLLHASLEDFVRSLEYWRLPSATEDTLDDVPIQSRGKRFLLGDLVAYRGQTVDELIKKSVEAHLERSNYNSSGDLAHALKSLGIDPITVSVSFPQLESLMQRRHQIVHRADQDPSGGSGNHRVKSIGIKAVRDWSKAVRKFSLDVLAQL